MYDRWILPLALVGCLAVGGCGDDGAELLDASRIADGGGDSGSGPTDAASDTDAQIAPDVSRPDGGLPDAGSGPGVVVANEGATALYHAHDGTLLAVRATPSEFPLPEGGQVTLIADRIYTFVDVASDDRIEVRGLPPAKSELLQSLQIDVPVAPDGKPINISTGCSGGSGPGTHTLAIDSRCLEADDTAELWIYAYDGGSGHYIHVDDIPIGNVGSAPLVVPLGAWIPFSGSAPTVHLSGLPTGFEPSLTTYALRGALPVTNVTSGFAMSSSTAGISTLATVIPDLGTQWRQVLLFEVRSTEAYASWTRRGSVRSLGHPLAVTSSVGASGLLPIPATIDLDAEAGFVSWTFEGELPTTVDRVRLTFHEDGSDRDWEIWMPPGRTQLRLPAIPAEFISMLPNPDRIEVRAEDRDEVSGWSRVLDGWAGEINFETSAWDWPGLGLHSNRWFAP